MTPEARRATLDAIARIKAGGSNLGRSMQVDFFFICAVEPSPALAAALEAIGLEVSLHYDEEDGTWGVTAMRHMILEAKAVLAFEQELAAIAGKHGAEYDGFGSFGNASD